MKNYAGLLLRKTRLARNLSQEGVCRGICAPSYLCKIEQGRADPAPELLAALFAALDVRYEQDSAFLAEGRRRLAQLFEQQDFDEDATENRAWLRANADRLSASELCLSAAVARITAALEAHDPVAAQAACDEAAPFTADMEPEEAYRFYLAAAALPEPPESPEELLRRALLLKSTCQAHFFLADRLFHAGRGAAALEEGQEAYRLACEEGCLSIMIWSSFLLGSCYTNACHQLEISERHYRRAIALSRGPRPAVAALAHYNLGASYLEQGDWDKALPHLLAAEGPSEGDTLHAFLLHQKLTLLYAKKGDAPEAKRHLAIAEKELAAIGTILSPAQRECARDMLQFAALRIRPNFLADPAYETVLCRLYEQVGSVFGYGFRRFHGLFLVELYRAGRRYKEALAVQETLEINY